MLPLRNHQNAYGLVSILLHWLVALAVIGLFVLGLWMVDLTYYSSWYKTAPFWHKSIGIILAAALFARLLWRLGNPQPKPPSNHKPWEIRLAHLTHFMLYSLLFGIVISGYLISTAKGQGISVFDWFEVPALITDLPQQADSAGKIHYWLALALMGLITLHVSGALKHHFIDRDPTLTRMLKPGPTKTKENLNE